MKANVLIIFKRCSALLAVAALVVGSLLAGCSKTEKTVSVLPNNGKNMTDEQIVAYLMKTVTPDSVARFICRASLGEIKGIKIDTLANATLYAYENYKDEDLQTFSQALSTYAESLPLSKRMRLLQLEAEQDEMGLGYQLGLEYVNDIRMNKKDVASIEKEIAELQKECAKQPQDSATFARFSKGFQVALDMDGSTDIPEQIYKKYSSNIPPEEAEENAKDKAKDKAKKKK